MYAIGCELGLTRIGVAADARQRLRQMQVGSPLPLELAGCHRFATAAAAYAACADVQRQLAQRHERGGWYRATGAQVGEAIGSRSAREAARAAAALAPPRPDAAALAAEAAERQRLAKARQRRRALVRARQARTHAAAYFLAAPYTQRTAATRLGVSERTLRRWTKLPGFDTELVKAHLRRNRTRQRPQSSDNSAAARRQQRHPKAESEQNASRQAPPPSSTEERQDGPESAQRRDRPAAPSHGRHPPLTLEPFSNAWIAWYSDRRLRSKIDLLNDNDARRGIIPPREQRARERQR